MFTAAGIPGIVLRKEGLSGKAVSTQYMDVVFHVPQHIW